MKKVVLWLAVAAVLVAAGLYGYQHYRSASVVTTAEASGYTQAAITAGSLTKSVTGTGVIGISETRDVELEYGVTVAKALVAAGDAVSEGDPILAVDPDAMQTTIDSLLTELSTCESDLASLAKAHSDKLYERSTIAGRVKALYVQIGRQVEDVMAEKGCIALLSLDGTMYAQIAAPADMSVNDAVTVRYGGAKIAGKVTQIADGMAKVVFSDALPDDGAEVTIKYGNYATVTATAHISMPYELTTTTKGYVYNVYVSAKDKVYSGSRLFYVVNVPISDEYKNKEALRAKLTKRLAEAQALKATGRITAPVNGIVASVVEPSVTEQAALTTLATLYVGDRKEMTISVDELDIINVSVGQTARIAMDAITDKTYPATVSYVSQIGTATSGVTTYSVTLDIEGDDQLKISMNGTATIHIGDVENVLLVPIAAMNSSNKGDYVWLYSEGYAASDDEPGVKTYITTGLSDENYAQVLSGLSLGDVVMITREAAATAQGGMGFGGMMDMGGGMPAGGAMPSGGSMPAGGTMPSGGGNRGNRDGQ